MSLPRMSLHIGDYKKDTGHLRAAGHGGYLLLMMHYWTTGSLPEDDKQLTSIACMTPREWKQWGPILKALFKGNWKTHKRIDKELSTAQEKYERRAKAGAQGGNAKAAKQCSSNATAKAKQPITDTLSGERETRASEPLISPEAYRLAEDCLFAIGFSLSDPPDGWSGLPYQTQVMVARGYDHARTVAAFARIGPGKPMTYHIKVAESDHIEAGKPERRNGTATRKGGREPNAITAAIDQHIANFERDAGDGGEVREAPAGLLSDGRR